MSGRLLDVQELTVGYGAVPVVHDLTLCVEPGQVVALMGANGAGKTTALRAIAGALPHRAACVELNGRRAPKGLHRRARSGLAYVSEERSVFMRLTVAQNLKVGGVAPGRAFERFPELEPLLHRRAGLLSGGEQQMLTLGRALCRTPRVLLADELSLGLAPLVVDRLLRAVREAADAGLGALLVEQHVHRILPIADRVVVLRQGRVALDCSGDEALARLPEIESAYSSTAEAPASAGATNPNERPFQ